MTNLEQSRKEFEEFYADDAMPMEAYWFERDADGEYENEDAREAWKFWQAATAAARAPLEAEIARLSEAEEESLAVIDKLSHMLAEIAITLKGEELALHRHSYHDLPALVASLKLALEKALVDAKRYQWLRNNSVGQFEYPIVVSQNHVVGSGMKYIGPLTDKSLDDAIDTALSQSEVNKDANLHE